MSGRNGTQSVQLFGEPCLLEGDGVVTLSRYQGALIALAYASGGAGIPRAEAAWLLWESEDDAATRHRLSQLLYAVRKRGGAACIEERGTEALIGPLPSDLDAVERAIAKRDLAALDPAAGLDLMGGLEPPTVSFAHWVDAKRAGLRARTQELAAAELARSEADGEWEPALVAAQLLLRFDPTDETILRSMMQAFAFARSSVELHAALRAHAERYRLAVGERWTPERETTLLLGRIEQLGRGRAAVTAVRTPSFVGRSKELRRLYESVTTPSDGIHFVVVSGAAGVGKTSLIRQSLERLRLGGYRILESGSSLLQRDLPLRSLTGALTDPVVVACIKELEEPWRSSLAVLLPDVAIGEPIPLAVLDPQATSRRLMESLFQLMRRVTADSPVVLFVDDLQWLDKTTLCALEFLRERVPALPLCVVLALRDDGEHDASVRSFLDLVAAVGERIELDELDQESAERLLIESAPRPLAMEERERISRAAGRNPFFLIELVNDYCARADRDPGLDPARHVPSSVRQLIGNRMRELSKEARTLLQLLSVAGTLKVEAPVPMDELSPVDLPDAADELLGARLIEHDAGTLRIRHDLIRQAAYELMGPVKRSVLHRRVAEAVIERMDVAGHGEAAVHFDKAGDRAAAYEYAASAATAAKATGAVPEAIRFWEAARRNATAPNEIARANGESAELLYDARRLEEAIQLLTAATPPSGTDEAARYELMRLDAASELPGADQEGSLREVERIAEEWAARGRWTKYAEAVEIRLRILDRLYRPDVIRTQLMILRQLRADGTFVTPYEQCLVCCMLALTTFYIDDEEGMADARMAVLIAREHELTSLILRAYHRKIFCHNIRGDLHRPEGQGTCEEALALAKSSGDIRSRASIHNTLACLYLDIRAFDTAERHLRQAEKLAPGPGERALVHCNLGSLFYEQGEYATAEHYFHTVRKEIEHQPVFGFLKVAVAAGLGLCSLAVGRLSEAQANESLVRKALDTWIHDPDILLQFLAELERRRGRPKEAVILVRKRAEVDLRRPVFWLKSKILEARFLQLFAPDEAADLRQLVRQEAEKRGLLSMLMD